jgi:hypothetical protein
LPLLLRLLLLYLRSLTRLLDLLTSDRLLTGRPSLPLRLLPSTRLPLASGIHAWLHPAGLLTTLRLKPTTLTTCIRLLTALLWLSILLEPPAALLRARLPPLVLEGVVALHRARVCI